MQKIAEAYLQKAKELANQQKWNKAIFHYKSAIEREPKLYDAYLDLGDCLRYNDNLDLAIKVYHKLVELKSDYWQVYSRFERLVEEPNISKDQLNTIVEIIKKSLVDNPDHPQNRTTLIYALSSLGKKEEAEAICKKTTYSNNLKLRPDFIQNHWQKDKLGKPNFMIIGFMKCGTTALYDYISQHRNFLPACQKEIMFFNNEKLFNLGVDWYKSNFLHIPDNCDYITGEASTLYVQYPEVAKKVKFFFPKIKIIILIRNPVHRAISHYYFMKELGYQIPPLEQLVDESIEEIQNIDNISNCMDGKLGIVKSSLYAYYIEQWLQFFDQNQILIVNTEDLLSNTNITVNKVFDFLQMPNIDIVPTTKKNVGKYQKLKSDDEIYIKLSIFFDIYNKNYRLNDLGLPVV